MSELGTCPLCGTDDTAFATWQQVEEKYRLAMDVTLSMGKPSIELRTQRNEATLALEKRRGCSGKHRIGDEETPPAAEEVPASEPEPEPVKAKAPAKAPVRNKR